MNGGGGRKKDPKLAMYEGPNTSTRGGGNAQDYSGALLPSTPDTRRENDDGASVQTIILHRTAPEEGKRTKLHNHDQEEQAEVNVVEAYNQRLRLLSLSSVREQVSLEVMFANKALGTVWAYVFSLLGCLCTCGLCIGSSLN